MSANAVESECIDALVIGGGVFGCVVALELSEQGKSVMLVDRGDKLLARASYCNQARIHQGYHYPRSILTAQRSRINFSRFVEDFSDCVESDFDKYYAIGRSFSKVTAVQFRQFCARIGAPIAKAPNYIRQMFDPYLIEEVFKVQEYAFNAVKLRSILQLRLNSVGVDTRLCTTAVSLERGANGLAVQLVNADAVPTTVVAGVVFNCTYSALNQILENSLRENVPLKHEMTEMALMEPPDELRGLGITVMDGPFFSFMPFPPRELNILSHVRYTPHYHWWDNQGEKLVDINDYLSRNPPVTRYRLMQKDAARYLPLLNSARYIDSIWEVKTLMPRSEMDDSRPILFRSSDREPRVISILGGKIDNLYDIRDRLRAYLLCSREVE